jgi:hypothetical protein
LIAIGVLHFHTNGKVKIGAALAFCGSLALIVAL